MSAGDKRGPEPWNGGVDRGQKRCGCRTVGYGRRCENRAYYLDRQTGMWICGLHVHVYRYSPDRIIRVPKVWYPHITRQRAIA